MNVLDLFMEICVHGITLDLRITGARIPSTSHTDIQVFIQVLIK